MATSNAPQSTPLVAPTESLSAHTEPVPIEALCSHIEKSTQLAAETEDYLSYATVLDLALGSPHRFTAEEASIVLATLYKSLSAYPIILYKVGWDLPELLLKYIDRFFVSEVEALPAQRPFQVVMSLFSLLCEHGNPRELLVRACDLMLATESELNSQRMEKLSLSENKEEQQHLKLSESNPTNIDSANNGFDVWDDTRQENVKFCTLFEVVRFSLQNIETSVPSSYLLQAARTMLQVADDPNADLLSVSTYARRMFLLARDFTMKNEESVSPDELRRVRQILCNFLAHAADVVVRRYTLKWAERLYVQMRNKVAMAPPNERDFVYTETEYTRRMSEVMSRYAQLMLSYDLEPQATTALLLGLKVVDGEIIEYSVPHDQFKVEGADLLADNYWSRQILNGPSVTGMGLLATELHFDGSRQKKPVWTTTAVFSLKMFSQCNKSKGTKDMLLYWALWISNYFESIMQEDTDPELLREWLQALLGLIATSSSPEEQFVTGSIVARALRFQSPDFAYNFCIDIMKRSKSSDEHFVIVETLKMLITGKISNPEPQSRQSPMPDGSKKPDTMLCTQRACVELNDERKKELTLAAKDAMHRLKNETRCLAWYYLNFLAVVPTDPATMIDICSFLDTMAAHCEQSAASETCLVQLNLVKEASAKLRQRAINELQRPVAM